MRKAGIGWADVILLAIIVVVFVFVIATIPPHPQVPYGAPQTSMTSLP